MLFNSYVFLFAFLPLAVLGFAWLNRWRSRAGTLWLVACSLFFYGWWDVRFLALLCPSIALNFGLARAMAGLPRASRGRHALLALGVGANLGAIALFKYADFVGRSANALLGTEWEALSLTLPLGISFFTFQQIAFLVDAHREKASGGDLGEYALFVSFFPQLIAGPIVHHAEMMPQFRSRPRLGIELESLSVGSTIFFLGLFKKVMLADPLSELASPTFAAADAGVVPLFVDAWLSALAYTLQLYFDFSGYSDMAIGIARVFGIKLPLNFDSPYKAVSIIDFWRRWHMTLSRFLRDYLYIPLGGNRHGAARRYVNLMLTMLLGGLWHGAGWTFVAWGGLHGGLLALNHGWRTLRSRLGMRPAAPGSPRALCGWAFTFLCVTFAWVLFRAETFEGALRMLQAMSGLDGVAASAFYETDKALRLVAPLLLWVWLAPNTQQVMADYEPALGRIDPIRPALRWKPSTLSACALALLALLAILNLASHSEFIYYQF